MSLCAPVVLYVLVVEYGRQMMMSNSKVFERTKSKVSSSSLRFSRISFFSAVGAVIVLCSSVVIFAHASGDTSAAASDSGIIEIYENWGHFTLNAPPPDMKPLVMQVPESFRYGLSRGAVRNWGLNLLTYYPSFTSPQAPENRGYGLGCKGECNGRILISVNYRVHAIHHPAFTWGDDYPNMGDYMARVTKKRGVVPNDSTVSELGPQHGFDTDREVREPPSNGISEQVYEYLAHLGRDHLHYDLFAECSINKFAKVCNLHFSLKCNPSIYVQVVGLEMSRLDAYQDVVDRTDRFLTPMVRSPVCK